MLGIRDTCCLYCVLQQNSTKLSLCMIVLCIYCLTMEISNQPLQKQTRVLSRTPWKWTSLQNGCAPVGINGDTRADYGKPQYKGPKVQHWWWSNRQWVLIEMSMPRRWPWRPGRRAIGRQHPKWRKMSVAGCHVAFVAGRETTQIHKCGWSSLFHQLRSESLRQTLPAAGDTGFTFILLKLCPLSSSEGLKMVIFCLWSAI